MVRTIHTMPAAHSWYKEMTLITLRQLADILATAFEAGQWGDIDPNLFRAVADNATGDDQSEYQSAMYEALRQAAAEINEMAS